MTRESREGGGKGAARKILRRGREVTKHATAKRHNAVASKTLTVTGYR